MGWTVMTVGWALFAAASSMTAFDDLELRACWEPPAGSKYVVHERYAVVREALGSGPAQAEASFDPSVLSALWPADTFEPGEVWELDPRDLVPVFEMFHDGVRTDLHHGRGAAPGGRACLRARGEGLVEVLFRLHVEFEWNSGQVFFTPAQFEGRLVGSPADREIFSFHVGLPARDTNYDLNYRSPDQRHGEADIGFVPCMELVGPTDETTREWDASISDEDARSRMRRSFYEFAKVEWLPLPEAYARCRKEGRSLHVVILFGSLDDESC